MAIIMLLHKEQNQLSLVYTAGNKQALQTITNNLNQQPKLNRNYMHSNIFHNIFRLADKLYALSLQFRTTVKITN